MEALGLVRLLPLLDAGSIIAFTVRPRSRCAVLALAAGLAAAPAPAAPAPGDRPAPLLRLGVIAEEANEPDRMFRVYEALVLALRERMAPTTRVPPLTVARDLDDLSRRLRAGAVDVVIETVFPTLMLAGKSGRLEPALLVERRGQREYHTVFFTLRESTIEHLSDLRGRSLALQALRSTSAFALPRAEIQRAGLTLVPADDPRAGPQAVRYQLAGAEINQAIWVATGKADAGAFNDGDWRAIPEKVRERLRVFHETAPLLRGVLSFRTGLDAGVRARALSVLVRLHEDPVGREALQRASGITRLDPLSPAQLESLRAWSSVLRPAQ
jgi:phosphonate transport system substrate-binding protein